MIGHMQHDNYKNDFISYRQKALAQNIMPKCSIHTLLGPASFFTVTFSLLCHLVAISSNNWTEYTCLKCLPNDPLRKWTTSLHRRCYEAPLSVVYQNDTSDLFIKNICFPKQHLIVKEFSQATNCFQSSLKQPDLVCPRRIFNENYCKCE